jgi:hypothetical protein
MIALFLGVKTESYSRGKNGFNDLRSWRKEYSKKLGSKKDQEKEEFLEEYLKEHFSEKDIFLEQTVTQSPESLPPNDSDGYGLVTVQMYQISESLA